MLLRIERCDETRKNEHPYQQLLCIPADEADGSMLWTIFRPIPPSGETFQPKDLIEVVKR